MNEPIPNPYHDPIWAYAKRERARVLIVSYGFAEGVERRLAADLRKRRLTRYAGMALAASVLLGVGFIALPRTIQEPAQNPQPAVEIAALPKLGEEWSEAGRSLENLTASAAKPALEPAKRLISGAENLRWPTPVGGEPRFPDFEFGPVAMAGLEPIANTPRRAVNTMLRDFGIAPLEK